MKLLSNSDDVRVGDYILLHTGFAIQKIDEAEALETLKVLTNLMN
jgi:hydrogenase expression/formation protein HypC